MTEHQNADGIEIWSTVRVRPRDDSVPALVGLFATLLPDVMSGREWFGVPGTGFIEVTARCPSSVLGAEVAALESLGHRVEDAGPRSVLDPELFPERKAWAGFPGLLCAATSVAVRALSGHEAFLWLGGDTTEQSVRAVVSLVAGPERSDEILIAAADFLDRTVVRRDPNRGPMPPTPPSPPEPRVVAGARVAHVHVVQVCGADSSVQRLAAEADLFRAMTGAAPLRGE